MTLGALLLLWLLPFWAGLAWDLSLGDPREGSAAERLYPPVLVGRAAMALTSRIVRDDPARESRQGALVWGLLVGGSTAAATLLVLAGGPLAERFLSSLPFPAPSPSVLLGGAVYLLLATFWWKSLFAVRGLLRFCERPLGEELERMRRLVAGVVNRDTSELPRELLHSALLESAAENTTDSVVSPVLAYALFGLPGAVAYRSINTLDAIMGHRDRTWVHVGRVAAAVDRWVNRVPDACTAAFLVVFSVRRRDAPPKVRLEEGGKVPSSIVAMSRALHVRLERRGSYVVGVGWPLPREEDVRAGLRRVKYASLVGFLLSSALLVALVDVGWPFLRP